MIPRAILQKNRHAFCAVYMLLCYFSYLCTEHVHEQNLDVFIFKIKC